MSCGSMFQAEEPCHYMVRRYSMLSKDVFQPRHAFLRVLSFLSMAGFLRRKKCMMHAENQGIVTWTHKGVSYLPKFCVWLS
jgi:hypothetical protein